MNGLPSWESIIKTPDWQQITDEEKNNVFKSYLKNISQLPDWRQLSQPEKFNVTRAMEKQGGLYEETKRPSIIKELIVPTIKEIPERTISGVKRLGKDISIGARQSFANMYHLLANIPGLEARLVDKVSAITGLPKSDSLKIAEKYLRDAAERVAPSIEEVKDYDSLLDKFTQGIGALPGTLAEYGPIVALKGPTIGMAVVDALRESDKGLVDSLIGGFRGAITGKGLELISGLGLPPAKKAITIGGLFATEPLVKGKYKEAVTSGGLGIVLGRIGGKETKGIRYDAEAIKKLEAIEKAKQFEEKIPNKGDILKLSESHKKTLNMVRNDIIQGEAGKKVTNEEGKFILIPSTFPKYFQNRGYSKEGTLKTIDKALRDEPLTQKQQAIIQDLNSGKRQEILEQYKFYKETGVPGGISAIADMGDYALRKMKLPAKPSIPQKSILPISELPEIVELSAKISKGEVPTIVSKLRAGMGKALGQYRKGKTYLKAETAKTPEVAKKTLAHEIGHYIEKLPQDYQTLGKAIKWTSGISSPLLKKQIMDELKVVSQIWKPFNEAENIRFTRYRYSPDELYADAFSVLINEPSLLLEKAPIFVDNFFKNIDKRPEFKKAYENIQDRLTNENTIIESRHNELTKMMQEGTKALFESTEKGINVWEAIKREFITKNGGIIDAIKKVERKTGRKISNEENPLYLIEEMPYISGQFYQHLRDITNNILNPALKNKISIDDIGMVEFANRVIHERSNIFNPRGHTPETALKELEFLKNKFGEEKYSQILDYINKIAEARAKNIISVLEQSEMFTPELISIIKDNKYYATFLPHKYIERTYGKGVSGQIFKQIGTFEDIINPFTALMMKDFVLLKSAITKMVKKGSMDWLKNNGFQDQILPAEYKFNGKVNVPIEPRNPKLGMVSYLHKGKVEAFYVPKEIAESFNRSPHEASLIMRTLETLTSPFKDLVVGKNPPWAIWNLFYRDISATAKQLPDASYWKILKLVPKALPHVWKDVMRGESTELMREMYEKRMLTPLRFWRGRDIPPEIAMASEILSLGKPNPNTPIYYATLPFIKLWNALDKPGRISERLTKVAGKIYLKETMPETTVHRVGHLVRARAGTPDLLEGGIRTRTFNTLFVFSNAGIQGMRAAIESAKESPLSYAWKTAKYDILPKTIMQIAKLGFLGTGVATIMSKIPDRDMENYVVVPLGLSVSGKAVYFIKPHDFQGQLVGGIFYNVMNSRKLEDYQSLLDFANGQMPYSSLNPWIQVGIDWLYYMTGKNPYDAWKGSYVLPEKMYEAGGKGALIAMLKHTSNSMGGSSIYRFRGDNPQAIKGELEKIYKVPFLEPALSRFIRVSDYGIQEKAKEDIKKVRKDRAIQYYKNKSILLRLMEGEELTPEDISTLSESVSIDNQLMSLLVAKHGSALGRALFHARSTEERVAIIREFQKREKKIKKRSEFLGGLKEALQ